MRKWTKAQRATLRRGMKALRRALLLPFAGWPRDTRAWARRDRIDTLITEIETDPQGPTKEDPARFARTVEELREWVKLEREFLREYPMFDVPKEWVARKLPPKTRAEARKTRGPSHGPRRVVR